MPQSCSTWLSMYRSKVFTMFLIVLTCGALPSLLLMITYDLVDPKLPVYYGSMNMHFTIPPYTDRPNVDAMNKRGSGRTSQKFLRRTKFRRSRLCPLPPQRAADLVDFSTALVSAYSERAYKKVAPGGKFRPTRCMARQTVAIIVPFRDRLEHLRECFFHFHETIASFMIVFRQFPKPYTSISTRTAHRIWNFCDRRNQHCYFQQRQIDEAHGA